MFFQHTFSGRRFPDNPGPIGELERHIGRGFARINTDQAGWARAAHPACAIRTGSRCPASNQRPSAQIRVPISFLWLRRRRSCTLKIGVQKSVPPKHTFSCLLRGSGGMGQLTRGALSRGSRTMTLEREALVRDEPRGPILPASLGRFPDRCWSRKSARFQRSSALLCLFLSVSGGPQSHRAIRPGPRLCRDPAPPTGSATRTRTCGNIEI